jgi:hypothetical protein
MSFLAYVFYCKKRVASSLDNAANFATLTKLVGEFKRFHKVKAPTCRNLVRTFQPKDKDLFVGHFVFSAPPSAQIIYGELDAKQKARPLLTGLR